MLRYVDIGDQIMEDSSQFAWFDTVIDRFLSFDDTYVWDSWEEFEDDFWFEISWRESNGENVLHKSNKYLERFKRLYPLNLRRDNPLEKELVLEED